MLVVHLSFLFQIECKSLEFKVWMVDSVIVGNSTLMLILGVVALVKLSLKKERSPCWQYKQNELILDRTKTILSSLGRRSMQVQPELAVQMKRICIQFTWEGL